MTNISNHVVMSTPTRTLDSSVATTHTVRVVTPGTAVAVTGYMQADQHKLSLQQLGHGSPENFSITPEQLDEQKAQLRPLMTATTPFSHNLSIQRHKPCSSTQFADFATATREQLTQLASTTSGQELLHSLDYQAMPTMVLEGMPSKEQYYRMPLGHHVSITNPDMNRPGVEEHTRFREREGFMKLNEDGTVKHAGHGCSSVVTHQPDALQRSGQLEHGMVGPPPDYNVRPLKEMEHSTYMGAVVLGHELIHASHASNGLSEFRRREDGLSRGEQFTVGLSNGDRVFNNIPTENMLRNDMNEQYFADATMVGPMPIRTSYTGKPIDDYQYEAQKQKPADS